MTGRVINHLLASYSTSSRLSIGFLGGSVTKQGQMIPGFVESLSNIGIKAAVTNYGIPATGPTYFSVCFEEIVTSQHNLFVLEFAVNDFEVPAVHFESIVSRVLAAQNSPGILIIIHCGLKHWKKQGCSHIGAQQHESIATKLEVPAVIVGPALSEYNSTGNNVTDLFRDGTHPTQLGGELIADLLHILTHRFVSYKADHCTGVSIHTRLAFRHKSIHSGPHCWSTRWNSSNFLIPYQMLGDWRFEINNNKYIEGKRSWITTVNASLVEFILPCKQETLRIFFTRNPDENSAGAIEVLRRDDENWITLGIINSYWKPNFRVIGSWAHPISINPGIEDTHLRIINHGNPFGNTADGISEFRLNAISC